MCIEKVPCFYRDNEVILNAWADGSTACKLTELSWTLEQIEPQISDVALNAWDCKIIKLSWALELMNYSLQVDEVVLNAWADGSGHS